MDQELKTEVDKINKNLEAILKKKESLVRAFGRGVMRGLGSVLGALFAALIVGWILNTLGIIPSLKQEALDFKHMWQQTLDQASKMR